MVVNTLHVGVGNGPFDEDIVLRRRQSIVGHGVGSFARAHLQSLVSVDVAAAEEAFHLRVARVEVVDRRHELVAQRRV